MVARIGYHSILIALLLGLAAALFLALLPRLHEQVVVRAGDIGPLLAEGETAQIRSFYGFNEVETADGTRFRWTDGIGNFVVRSGARLGESLILEMRLCGCRGGKNSVSRLLLRVNGIALADATALAAPAQWRRYALLAPPIDTAYSPDLLVELSSDTIKNPQFGYRMGVALDSVALLPATRQRAYSPASALALGLSIGALALATWTKDEGRRTNVGAIHLSFVGTAALGLALVALQGVFYRHDTLPIEIPAFGLLLSLGLALRANAPPATAIVVALLLGALVVLPQVLGTWMLDDAYISFRYARNALMGHGFVFNPGEQVEGYTNFLWTVLFVPILGAGLNPALVSQIITLLLALTTAALTWGSARRMAGTVAATAALALLATSTPFIL